MCNERIRRQLNTISSLLLTLGLFLGCIGFMVLPTVPLYGSVLAGFCAYTYLEEAIVITFKMTGNKDDIFGEGSKTDSLA